MTGEAFAITTIGWAISMGLFLLAVWLLPPKDDSDQ
jgi:hypothetical protein